MRIAIDGRYLSMAGAAERYFGAGMIGPFIQQAPADHHFILIYDEDNAAPPAPLPNMTPVAVKMKAGSPLLQAFWYDYRLPSLLGRYRADHFIGAAGSISLRSGIKQSLWLFDTAAGYKDGALIARTAGPLYRRRLRAMLNKASNVYTNFFGEVEALWKNAPPLQQHLYTTGPVLLHPYPPMTDGEITQTKHAFTDGKEYFLCADGWNDVQSATELLLHFSAFKKRMRSGMKLVLMGAGPEGKEWPEKLSTYRYRNDVVVVPSPAKELACKLLAGAYALVQLPRATDVNRVMQALHAGVPVLGPGTQVLGETAGDALLTCSDAPGENLGQRLIQLYKDEAMRKEMMIKGRQKSLDHDPEAVAKKLWQGI
ncbi:MAG TPA: hypothetical protein VK907_08560 [Phnomibacter sp.]|nr:hypothetical protein [Phnomibacter sp.]